jgi:hypothetical protein
MLLLIYTQQAEVPFCSSPVPDICAAAAAAPLITAQVVEHHACTVEVHSRAWLTGSGSSTSSNTDPSSICVLAGASMPAASQSVSEWLSAWCNA